MFTNKDIARHFDFCEAHYRVWWNLKESKSMHFGYWDKSTRNLHAALMKINKVMSQKAGIKEHHHVLDAGCGVGGSSLWLAKNIGCHVTGITLSEKQRAQAEVSAANFGLADKAQFFQRDYLDTGFPDESFDVVWAIESVCYAESKHSFLKEASRLLKPGGVVIVADFFKRAGLEGNDKKAIDDMAYGWAITDFSTIEDFTHFAIQEGLQNAHAEDISVAVTPSARKLYRYSIPGMVITKIYDVLFHATELSKYHARTVNIQYPALKRGLWKYYLFTAQKPV